MEPWRLFWAKTNREKIEGLPPDWTHPLWAHLLDVGSAAQVLWNKFLPAILKQKMAAALSMDEDAAGRFLSIWIGLHDLGKGIPSFQYQLADEEIFSVKFAAFSQQWATQGMIFPNLLTSMHHGFASIAIVWNWLRAKTIVSESSNGTLLDAMAACVGIHHGKLCKEPTWKSAVGSYHSGAKLGNRHWQQAQVDLAQAVFDAWGAVWPAAAVKAAELAEDEWPNWLMAFAGWATLADWLGSMQSCYDPHVAADADLKAYVSTSYAGAEKAYQATNLNQQAALHAGEFEQHFGFKPRDLQVIASKYELVRSAPQLLIVEAPTGEGKTEAAFFLAARFGGGLYVAMPSQATSDGLHPRLRKFITGRRDQLIAAHRGPVAALRLVHGNDLLVPDASVLVRIEQQVASVSDSAVEAVTEELFDSQTIGRVLGWFLPKKRALLVPYGVGTVDQLFLGVLHARHFFLRLFALSGKTVIFDEVHAYDTYMNTIFGRLLAWLRALDVQVIVLSATLPGQTRADILRAWGVSEEALATLPQPAPYPMLWSAAEGQVRFEKFDFDRNRRQQLRFSWCPTAVLDIATKARQLLAAGATVMVVCNTVERAQCVFELLDNAKVVPRQADRLLLHARMPQAERKKREKAALKRFGKDRPTRPGGLLVGTQIVEQSLDLDADALITDLPPIDLLLQRAGRLHRHQRDGQEGRPQRPPGFTRPVLVIACDQCPEGTLPEKEALPDKGYVYAPVVLAKTYAVLRQYKGWALPVGEGQYPGYRQLVEAVYGDLNSPPHDLTAAEQTRYTQLYTTWEEEDNNSTREATQRLVRAPGKLAELFEVSKEELVEEDDSSGKRVPKYLRAATRNPDSVNVEVLVLYRNADGWATKLRGPTVLPLAPVRLTPPVIRTLFGASVRLSHQGLVRHYWDHPNQEWQHLQRQQPLLQRFHLLELDAHQATTIGRYAVRLDKRLGLRIS